MGKQALATATAAASGGRLSVPLDPSLRTAHVAALPWPRLPLRLTTTPHLHTSPQPSAGPPLPSPSPILNPTPTLLLPPLHLASPQVSPVAAKAVVAPVATLSDEQRAELAAELGYLKIGKELPDTVSLTDIVKTMPPEVR